MPFKSLSLEKGIEYFLRNLCVAVLEGRLIRFFSKAQDQMVSYLTPRPCSHGYDIIPFHFGPFQKVVRSSHGYGKNQAVRSKTGPEIGRYGKVNQKLERYDIVPFRSRVNRSGTIS